MAANDIHMRQLYPQQPVTPAAYYRALFPYTLAARWFALGPRWHACTFGYGAPAGANVKYSRHAFPTVPTDTPAALKQYLIKRGDALTAVHVRQAAPQGAEGAVGLAQQQELVMDIDVSDYDVVSPGVRAALGCRCAGAKRACRACWLIIRVAVAVLRRLLQVYDLGEPLVVFSGSKGVHVWYGNARARALSETQRKTLAAEMRRWRTPAGRAGATGPLLAAVMETWREAAKSAVLAPEWLASFLPAGSGREHWNTIWHQRPVTDRWAMFEAFCAHVGAVDAPVRAALAAALPAVDIAVFQKGHLIKLPFSLHDRPPHRVALPLSARALAVCDPEQMPSAVAGTSTTEAWSEACETMRVWLDACDYPRV